MERRRACSMAAAAMAWLGCAACDSKPIVLLGHVPVVDAAVRVEDARVDNHPGEDFECEELDPVCGKDGVQYRNTCQALDHGTTVAKRGPC